METEGLLDLAVEVARRAGALLLEHFEKPVSGVETKSTPTDPVSDADRASEALVLEFIAQHRSQDGVLAEEGGRNESSSGLRWIVDPLDGTVNFLFRIPHWGVSIAVEDADGAVVGVVHHPCRNEMFTAVRGGGTKLNGRAVRVGHATDLSRSLIATGFSYDPGARKVQAGILHNVLPHVRDIRRGGAATLDFADLSCGRFDGFYESPMQHWDKAAGVLLVAEAGGVVGDLPPLVGDAPGVIAAGPGLYDALGALVLG